MLIELFNSYNPQSLGCKHQDVQRMQHSLKGDHPASGSVEQLDPSEKLFNPISGPSHDWAHWGQRTAWGGHRWK